MLSEQDLRELLDTTLPDPILSLYLSTDPTEGNADAHRLRLRNLLKDVDLPQDVKTIERYFDHEHDWTGRSVAVFSCAPQGFFRAFSLAIPIHSSVHIDRRPVVKPLVNLVDVYGGYGVVLVDKQGARMFYFNLGELKEQEGVLGELVKHTKRGGASAVPGRRGGMAGKTHYEDEVVGRNMKDEAEATRRFFEENHVRRVLIGGTDDNVAMFRALLPKAWQSLVLGTFPMSMTASRVEVLDKVMQVGREIEQRRQSRTADSAGVPEVKGAVGKY